MTSKNQDKKTDLSSENKEKTAKAKTSPLIITIFFIVPFISILLSALSFVILFYSLKDVPGTLPISTQIALIILGGALGLMVLWVLVYLIWGKLEEGKDNFLAKLSFFISLGFWVPLFNIGICIVSFILAVKAYKLYRTDKAKFGGLGYIIAALIIDLSAVLMSVIGLLLFLLSKNICLSEMCKAAIAAATA